MFKKDYKDAFSGIRPSEESLDRTRNAMAEAARPVRRSGIIRRLAIACLCVALVGTSVFAAFRISDAMNKKGGTPVISAQSGFVYNNIVFKGADGIIRAEDYDDIYDTIKNLKFNNYFDGLETEVANDAVAVPKPGDFYSKGEAANGAEETNEDEHSDTNNQVEGVQEGDIVKNDGRYIYAYSPTECKIRISEAVNGKLTLLSEYSLGEGEDYYKQGEMMLCGDSLVIIYNSYKNEIMTNGDDGEIITETSDTGYSVYKTHRFTSSFVFDISDRSNPKLKAENSQSGFYASARMVGEVLYIVSNYSVNNYRDILMPSDIPSDLYNDKVSIYNDTSESVPALEDFVPEIDGELIPPECIFMAENPANANYTVITATDVGGNADEFVSDIAVLGISGSIYSSENNLYLTQYKYKERNGDIAESGSDENDKDKLECYGQTDIYRISLNEGKIVFAAAGSVNGAVLNQFSMDEYDGCFRIAATGDYSDGVSRSCVYALDSELNLLGASETLGKTERIKSVRFMGKICYVVTFRQTDPLYAIDFSDPANPKTLSELKIDGFSTYMHSFGDGLLLGIGNSATDNGILNGIKLTMFDTSDLSDIFDISSYVYSWDNNYYYTEALYNHKAILVDVRKNLIGIPLISDNYNDGNFTMGSTYEFFGFDGKTFVTRGTVSIDSNKEYWDSSVRGLYIGDYAYIASSSGIIAVSLDSFDVTDKLDYN